MPKLLGYAETLSKAIVDFCENERLKRARAEFDKAAREAEKTKDTSRLEDIFKGK